MNDHESTGDTDRSVVSEPLLDEPKGAARNGACFCGSGRKLKRCCGTREVVEKNRAIAAEEARKARIAEEEKRREEFRLKHGKEPPVTYRPSVTSLSVAMLGLAVGSLGPSMRPEYRRTYGR